MRRRRGRFVLYDDAGDGFGYERGRFSRTPITQTRHRGITRLRIGPSRGGFPGEARRRAWIVRLAGVPRPRHVTAGGRSTTRWRYDRKARTVTIRTARLATDERTVIQIGR